METTIKRLRKSFKMAAKRADKAIMTKADLLAAYADAKEQVEFQPPTRIRPRCKWRVTKFICDEMGTLKLYPESKKSWIHRGGLWYWSTKAEVAKILEGYGLTVEDFITAALQTFWLEKMFSEAIK